MAFKLLHMTICHSRVSFLNQAYTRELYPVLHSNCITSSDKELQVDLLLDAHN
jgi:hypothetical protein